MRIENSSLLEYHTSLRCSTQSIAHSIQIQSDANIRALATMKTFQLLQAVALSFISTFSIVSGAQGSFSPQSNLQALSRSCVGHCPAFLFQNRSSSRSFSSAIQQGKSQNSDAPLDPRHEGQKSSTFPRRKESSDAPWTHHRQSPNKNHGHGDAHGKYHRAVHQAEHRAKEKAAFGIAEHVTEQVSKVAEKGLAKHFGELVVKETGERMVERAAQRTGGEMIGKLGERVSERAGERAGERLVERTGERIAEMTGERIAERTAKRKSQEAMKKVGEHFADRALEEAGGKLFRRSMNKAGTEVVEKIGERVAERGTERALEHVGGETAARVLDRSSERLGERFFGHTGRGKRGLERTIEVSGEKFAVRVAENGAERLVGRLTKGLMIALPAIGGLFALYLFTTDVERIKEEWPHRIKPSLVMFAGATVADLADMFLHFFLFAGLLAHWSHHKLVVVEKLSLTCAVISTVCAVVGEIVSFNVRKRRGVSSSAAKD